MKNKTNVERIKHIMEYSEHGALMQLFIIDALSKYSEHVVKNEKELKDSMRNSFIHPGAWVGCAKELNEYLNKNY